MDIPKGCVSIYDFRKKLEPYGIYVNFAEGYAVNEEQMEYYLKLVETIADVVKDGKETIEELNMGFYFNGEFVQSNEEDSESIRINTKTLFPKNIDGTFEAVIIRIYLLPNDSNVFVDMLKHYDLTDFIDILKHCSEFSGTEGNDDGSYLLLRFTIPNLFVNLNNTSEVG